MHSVRYDFFSSESAFYKSTYSVDIVFYYLHKYYMYVFSSEATL